MKKVYGEEKIHPSWPLISDHLAHLPAAILTLTTALSAEDREVLAYLISCSSGSFISNTISSNSSRTHKRTTNDKSSSRRDDDEHPSRFNCDCFKCYMSYWVKWDASPNRQLIHEIIDAFEDWLFHEHHHEMKLKMKNKKKEKNWAKGRRYYNKRFEDMVISSSNGDNDNDKLIGDNKKSKSIQMIVMDGATTGVDHGNNNETEDDIIDQSGSSVTGFMSFIGAKIWGTIWNSH